MASAHHVARRAKTATKRGASNSWLEFLERAGYVVRGVLYGAMGTFALGLALGLGGTATDQSGSLVILTGGPIGKVLLFAVVIGLGAYSIWGFVRAIFDPLNRGDGPSGIAARLGFVWSGIAYAAIAIFALHLIAGGAPASSRDSTQEAIAKVLALPAGPRATVAIGIVAIGVGLAQLIDAYRAILKKDLKRTKMNQAEKEIVDALGRLGMVARGGTFSVVAWLGREG